MQADHNDSNLDASFASAVDLTAEAPKRPKKTRLSLRLDPDIIEWFKAQGGAYQTNMNTVLRAFMAARKRIT